MFEFFDRMLPNFEKRRVLKSCDVVTQRCEDTLMRALVVIINSGDVMGHATSDKFAKEFEKQAIRLGGSRLKPVDKANYATLINAAAERMVDKTTKLRNVAEGYFANNVVKDGINYKQLNILRLIDLADFFVTYSNRFIAQTVYAQTIAMGVKNVDNLKPLTPNHLKWLHKHIADYLKVWSIFLDKNIDIDKVIKSTSSMIVSEAGDSQGTYDRDPLQMNFIPVVSDIFKFIGQQQVLRENERYEADKETLKALQMYLVLQRNKLENSEEGEDQAILKAIDYHTERAKELEYKIEQYEKKAGVYDV